MMRIRRFGSVLDECVAAIQQGETLEACLARYPRYADRLRPMLVLAERVGKTPAVTPRPWAHETAWNVVRERAADLRSGRRRARLDVHYGMWWRPLAVAMALVLAVIFGGGATAVAAQSALPDSSLYPVKLWTEDARLWFVFDDSHKADILMDQSDRRVDEIMSMVRDGKDIPDNVLSTLRDRNERAARIVAEQPADTTLRARLLQQSASQEDLLIALWGNVSASGRVSYTEAVALAHNSRLQTSGGLVSAADLAGGFVSISGEAQPLGGGLWDVGGMQVSVDERTIGSRGLQPGTTARIVAARDAGTGLLALSLTTIAMGAPASDAMVSGDIEEVTTDGIRVAGQFIQVTPETLKTLNLKQGERVEVTLGSTAGGIAATSVKQTEGAALLFEGALEGDASRGQWRIGGLTFQMTGSTRVDARAGKAQNAARVQVEATVQDGQLVANSATVLAATTAPTSAHLVGTFQGLQEGYWIVSGIRIVPPSGGANPQTGALLAIDLRRDGTDLQALDVTSLRGPDDSGLIRLLTTIKKAGSTTWDLSIGQVLVTPDTPSFGEPVVGARAFIWGRQGPDKTLQASFIWVLDEAPVAATPTPTPAPTPAP